MIIKFIKLYVKLATTIAAVLTAILPILKPQVKTSIKTSNNLFDEFNNFPSQKNKNTENIINCKYYDIDEIQS